MYSSCTTSRVSGAIDIGPRGLSHAMPFMAAIMASPPVSFSASWIRCIES
jgi:hypothetical protein